MPDALIVADQHKLGRIALNQMVKIGLIKCVSIGGIKVYGRHYLTNYAIRKAYYRQKGIKI